MVSFEQAINKQLCGILDELKKIRQLEEIKESRDVGVVYVAIPENAGTRSFSMGTTKINFISGSITNPNGSTESIQTRLDRLGKDFLHSLSLTSDQDIILQIGSGGKKTVQSNLSLEIPYSTFNEITITTTLTTNISIYASTNPFSTVNGNTVSIMKGQNAGSLVTVALDSLGNILGVLKGDYGGTLKTLATDDAGRLLAKIYDPQNIFGVSLNIGLAENASRVGLSSPQYDKRGEVSWYDDFEGLTLQWNILTFGNASGGLSTTRAHTASQSVFLNSGTGFSSFARIQKYLQYLASSRIGFEGWISTAVPGGTSSIQINVTKYDGTTAYSAKILYRPCDGELYYLNAANAYVLFGSNAWTAYDFSLWFPFKIVVDFATGKYVRFLFSDTTYDISTQNIYSTPNATTKRTEISIGCFNHDIDNQQLFVDDIVFSVNEP